MPYVLLFCVVILGFFALLMASAQNLASGMRSIDGKNATFDAGLRLPMLDTDTDYPAMAEA